MGNKQTIKLLFVLIFCTAYIFSFSHFGALAYDSIMNQDNSFDEGTLIGSVDVSGKTKTEAMKMVDDQLTRWLEDTTINVHFREKTKNFDLRYLSFQIKESVNMANNGQQNNLTVELDDITPYLTEFSSIITNTEFDLDMFKSEILNLANSLKLGQFDIDLEAFSMGKESQNSVINKVTINLNSTSTSGRSIGQLKELEIAPNSQFSLLAKVEELGLSAIPVESLNTIASSIYEVILPTNFSIIERHISESLPDYAKIGFESKVNPEINLDFIFFNPNNKTFSLQFELSNTQLNVSLKGPSFLNQYEIIVKDKETFKPKTILQFNPNLKPNEKIVETKGKDGLLVRVYRETYDEKGQELKNEKLSEDFYPPIHQIEIHGLIDEKNTPSVGENSNQTSEEGDSNTIENENEQDESTISDTQDVNPGSNNGLWGKPNEKFK